MKNIFGGVVAGTDVAIDNNITTCGNLDDVGAHPLHQQHPSVPRVFGAPAARVPAPDLVYVHPPSRGWPACSWLYGARVNSDVRENLERDLAYMLERRTYVGRIAEAVRTAAAPASRRRHPQPGNPRVHEVPPGACSRSRDRGRHPLIRLGPDARLLERHEVIDDAPVRQTSLDRSRGPLVHLVLAQPGGPR